MYQVNNPAEQAMSGMNQAAGTYGSMMKNIPKPERPGPTVGGGMMSAMGGATTGATIGSMMATPAAIKAGGTLAAVGGPIPMALGAVVGIGAYLLS